MFDKLKILATVVQGLFIALIAYLVMLMYYNSTEHVHEHIHVHEETKHVTSLPNSTEYPNVLDDVWGFLPNYVDEFREPSNTVSGAETNSL
jgi:hypothetical protein